MSTSLSRVWTKQEIDVLSAISYFPRFYSFEMKDIKFAMRREECILNELASVGLTLHHIGLLLQKSDKPKVDGIKIPKQSIIDSLLEVPILVNLDCFELQCCLQYLYCFGVTIASLSKFFDYQPEIEDNKIRSYNFMLNKVNT